MVTHKNLDIVENEQFILTGRLSVEEHFAEGLTHLFFGFPITKVLLHTIIEPQNGSSPEIRKAEQYLTMPTVTAIEFANLILATAKQSEDQLLKDMNVGAREKVKAILQNYKANTSTQGYESTEIQSSATVEAKKIK